jgi:MFS family permease
MSQDFYLQWFARFICGFFGGTFSFVGGIRVLANLFPHRFTLFIGLFLSAGMLGGLICQYPLLISVNYFGISTYEKLNLREGFASCVTR